MKCYDELIATIEGALLSACREDKAAFAAWADGTDFAAWAEAVIETVEDEEKGPDGVPF